MKELLLLLLFVRAVDSSCKNPASDNIFKRFQRKTEYCPVGCPLGWSTWGPTTKNCYLMPCQPMKRGNWTEMTEYCKQSACPSYLLVINDPLEQAVGTAIVQQYAANYFADLTDIFVWFGARKLNGKWVYEDGSDGSFNLNIIDMLLKNAPDGSCLCAEPKLLGVWLTKSCDVNAGAGICEMSPYPVCGQQGGGLPIGCIGGGGLKSLLDLGPKLGLGGLAGLAGNIPGIGR